jgi:phosphopantothenoylcysteine decarboxylase/phosphopantothenate--cysteine ligase
LADDLASTTLLATDKPVLMAPAMNVRMWTHAATQRNLATLTRDGVRFVGPDEGAMACGEFGFGRMAEPHVIFTAALAVLSQGARPLDGRRALVTAGPTLEPLDPVRVLTNRSSGRQGYAIAAALAELGAHVTLVSGPTALAPPPGVRRAEVETALEMLEACQGALPVDVAVLTAAVADWRPERVSAQKQKKTVGTAPEPIRLVENPDILATLSGPGPSRPALVIGFAAETEQVEAHATAKLARKGCDWIVANDVTAPGVMGGTENEVMVIDRTGVERWTRATKAEIAARLAQRIADTLSTAAKGLST